MIEPSTIECAWIAGFFEADGHFNFRPDDRRVFPGIGQKDPWVLTWALERFGGRITIRTGTTSYGSPRIPRWQVSSRAEVERFVSLVGPYIKTPPEMAKLRVARELLGMEDA